VKLTLLPPPPLCALLRMCESSPLPKEILDCGAGGPFPPLALFADYGYFCAGVDLSPERAELARQFGAEHGLAFDIREANMCQLPFEDHSFSFVYSINTIFHLSKADSALAVFEMGRVMRPNGILYVNFLSEDDGGYAEGTEQGAGEFFQEEDGQQVLHSYYRDAEPDGLFSSFEIVMKIKRSIDARHAGQMVHLAYLDYYARKLE
jgi:SAM-dependent methyltransferase